MKKYTTYLTILFLLLTMTSCDFLKQLFNGTGSVVAIPDTALCFKDARMMEENYIALKDIDTNNELDHRIISFTHKQMEDNLEYLTSEALKRGIKEEELGFRVYFGAKKGVDFNRPFTKGELKSVNNGEEAYSTVFFVATEKGESEDENDYTNIYDIPALNYGGSRRPPNNPYRPGPDKECPLIGTNGHTH